MGLVWRCATLFALVAVFGAGQPPKSQSKSESGVGGVIIGRSGKPLAHARLFLAQVAGDQELIQARVKIGGLPITQANAQGQFQFGHIAPGPYTVVYQPAGAPSIVPAEISIKAFAAETRSILPLMRNVEIGTSEPMAERSWGGQYTLLKGHTFWGTGTNMHIWNATIRYGRQGPYMEIRKGSIWQQRLDDKSQVKLEAWGF